MDSDRLEQFPGLARVIRLDVDDPEDIVVVQFAIEDDMEGEGQSFLEKDATEARFDNDLEELSSCSSQHACNEDLYRVVDECAISVRKRTQQSYDNIAKKFILFLEAFGFISNGAADNLKRWASNPNSRAPYWICAFIMHDCDNIDFMTGAEKPLSQRRNGLSHAQKERSAMTNLFGLLGGNGAMQWHQDRATGLMVGNPSISPLVSRYMLGLAKRKSLSGESPTSARAITPEIMRLLYRRNRRDYMNLENECLKERLVQACYTLAFLCLLRFDEVLKLQVSDLRWICDSKGRRVVVQLPFRKTAHSLAKIQPMILWPLGPEEAHLCPYRALCEWIDASGIKDGYLFPKLSNDGRVKSTATPEHMTSEMFLEHFRHDLLDVGIKFTPYGTHSFRRGGCQYLLVYRRWNIRRICEWGGWSTDFTYMTIVKYIISYVDEPMTSREDFFRPGPHVNRQCNLCGRRCACNS